MYHHVPLEFGHMLQTIKGDLPVPTINEKIVENHQYLLN